MNIRDLEAVVVFDCYCDTDIFWENVGRDRENVIAEVKAAKTNSNLMKIVNRYI